MPYIPPTGLIGSEQALKQGLAGQMGAINQGYDQAAGVMNPFLAGGGGAADLRAAYSGAMGAPAQAQAFQNFQSSPGQQFLLEQAEKASIRNAQATGGVGGGNVQQELQRQAMGFAQNDFQNQFNNLGQIQAGAQNAAGTQANIFGQQGQSLGGAIGAAGNNLAQGRFATGQQLAQAAGNTSANLSNLQNQLGGQLSNVYGQGSTNLANTVSNAGQGSANIQQQLATILANIGTGTGSQLANQANVAAQYDSAGILGQNQAVQNTMSQLMQLIPQGGGYQQPQWANLNSGYGYNVNPTQSGTQLSGTAGQMVG